MAIRNNTLTPFSASELAIARMQVVRLDRHVQMWGPTQSMAQRERRLAVLEAIDALSSALDAIGVPSHTTEA